MSKKSSFIKKITPIVRNKFFLTGILFIIWVSLFDENNLIERFQLNKEYNQLIKDKSYYLKRIETDSKRLEELQTDNKNLEKFAREQYLMKKENEDVYIIIRK